MTAIAGNEARLTVPSVLPCWSDWWLCCWCSTAGDVFSQQFDDMLGLLQSLEARLTDLYGRFASVLVWLQICLKINHDLNWLAFLALIHFSLIFWCFWLDSRRVSSL